jgi:uncharacterized membrane protein
VSHGRHKNRPPFKPQQQAQPVTTITHVEASYTGPIPPPGMLVKYNEAVPGAADRILVMAERQSAHREAIESKVVDAGIKSQTRGSWFGFIISMTAIVGGIYLIKLGKSTEGLIAIIGSLAALAGVFVYGKRKESKELKEKSDALAKRMNKS